MRGSVIDEVVYGYQLNSSGNMTNYTYHHDALESVLGQSGNTGTVVAAQGYTAFGSTVNATGSSNNTLKFTGRDQDMETGLYYYRARYYDSLTGRFLSEDPIRSGINWYTYANNNPINYNDPFGLQPPPINPGYAVIQQNVNIATGIYNPFTFQSYVKDGGIWDYKVQPGYGSDYQNFGNYNYGLTGAATGLFTPYTLLQQADINQINNGRSSPNWGVPNEDGAQGDDPTDQHWIMQGIQDYYSGMYGPPSYINLMVSFTSIYSWGNSTIFYNTPQPSWYRNNKSTINNNQGTGSGKTQNSSSSANQAANASAAAINSAMDAVNSAINPPSVTQAAPTATLTTELLGFGEDAADGGFILYPNMSNTNQIQWVYSKH